MTGAGPYEVAAIALMLGGLLGWIGHEFGYVTGYRAGAEAALSAFTAKVAATGKEGANAPRAH